MVTREECIALRNRDLFVRTIVPELFCPVMDEFSEPAGYMNEIVCSRLVKIFYAKKWCTAGIFLKMFR